MASQFYFMCKNQYGNELILSNNPDYEIISITGLTPAGAIINTDTVGLSDGSRFNSSRVGNRNIVITLKYKGDVEKNRIALYKIFKTKQYIELYYSNRSRKVHIEGRVETFDGNLFERGQMAAISIICPKPYFKGIDTLMTEFSTVAPALTFPVAFPEAGIPFSTLTPYAEKVIINEGDTETGVIIELRARELVLEPTIYNVLTNEQFSIRFEMQEGDLITINTNSGEKGIYLTSQGVQTNIINKVYKGATWFQLASGDNIFTYNCVFGAENLDVLFYTTPLYEGV